MIEFCCEDYPIDVRKDCKKVGEIRAINGGWSFFKKGLKDRRETFENKKDAFIDVYKYYNLDYKSLNNE